MAAVPTISTDDPAGDPAVRPQDDLFRAVNGRWLREAVIPPDRSVDGAFHALRDDSEAACREIVEEVAGQQDAAPGTPEQLIGGLYRSFMDTERIEQIGLAPVREQVARVQGIGSVGDLVESVGALRRAGVGGFFAVDVDSDPAQPDRNVANLWQAGLGLPDESYYRDEQYAEIREQYRTHLAEMLTLAGLDDAPARADRVLALETDIASRHWDRVRCRDADQTYNPMDRAGLDELLPSWVLDRWCAGARTPATAFDAVVVRQPDYFAGLADLLTDERVDAWRDWLSAEILHATAPLGPEALVQANFDFYGRIISGTPELRERWKRGVGLVERAVGEALGALYVQRHFPPAAKERMDTLVEHLMDAYRLSIRELDWMSEDTKVRALEKVEAFTPKVGYPVRFRDYAGLTIDPADLLGNAARAAALDFDRDMGKIGQPVDRDEWFMTPQTVNAYYNPGMNEIVFPAAILRPPFFDMDADDAANFGGIGAVIGHEIGHGFDDQGSKYDGTGALHDWWTQADRDAFDALTRKLIDQYSALEPAQLPGHPVNGALTVGENIGDLGGLGIAFQAWVIARVEDGLPGTPPDEDVQRMFLQWAKLWRTKIRDQEALRYLAIDPHSPAEFRCNQVVRNLDEFHRAFGVTEGDAMWLAPEERVRIW
ncbi:peptidase M13 [Nakamurella flavida]|uniref:Peptidase M13 n=1 Tax=Nakamurella flavida TaxID=363630 RepID=A0A938YRI9_9ACTN|nr:M13-type metalloendopeptidase [Nakamurella flavida]MBM9477908.1 peptidase M13 [Nakamurella flavida]MDP9778377.1 putative endopeptidase [Nakamurella flavida]